MNHAQLFDKQNYKKRRIGKKKEKTFTAFRTKQTVANELIINLGLTETSKNKALKRLNFCFYLTPKIIMYETSRVSTNETRTLFCK